MNEVSILISVASFFAGALLTVIIFVIPFVGRMARVEAVLANLVVQVNKLEVMRLPCVDHTSMMSDVRVTTEKVRQLAEAMSKNTSER